MSLEQEQEETEAAIPVGFYFMGMCSRQERIQKDVDIVIQSCKAEKDCLFSGEFLYTVSGIYSEVIKGQLARITVRPNVASKNNPGLLQIVYNIPDSL